MWARRLLLALILAVGVIGGALAWSATRSGRSLSWLSLIFGPPQTLAGRQIGIVAGHSGYDSGAVCPDGLTEASVNQAIAQAVTADLAGRGARVDLLAEFDGRLAGYSADAFVAIHADSCTAESRYSGVESGYVGVDLSGFKVAGRAGGDKASQELADCLWDRYEAATGLARHPDTISRDMRDYHAFRRIAPTTPAAIIEVGFLKADRELLTAHADRAVAGIVAGIECFLGGLP